MAERGASRAARRGDGDEPYALSGRLSRTHLDDDVESIRRASSGHMYEMPDQPGGRGLSSYERGGAGAGSAPSTPVGRWAAATASVRRGEYSDERDDRAGARDEYDDDDAPNDDDDYGYDERYDERAVRGGSGYAAAQRGASSRDDRRAPGQAPSLGVVQPPSTRNSWAARADAYYGLGVDLDASGEYAEDIPATARSDRSQGRLPAPAARPGSAGTRTRTPEPLARQPAAAAAKSAAEARRGRLSYEAGGGGQTGVPRASAYDDGAPADGQWAPPYGGAHGQDGPAGASRAARHRTGERDAVRPRPRGDAYAADPAPYASAPPVPFPNKRDLYEYIRELATAQAAVREDSDPGGLARLRELPKPGRAALGLGRAA